ATAVALDWLPAALPGPAGRNPGSDVAAIPRPEHPRSNPRRPAGARSSPATETTHPSGLTAGRLPGPQPRPGGRHTASRPAAASPRKVSAPGSLPANDAPKVPPNVPARLSASAGGPPSIPPNTPV